MCVHEYCSKFILMYVMPHEKSATTSLVALSAITKRRSKSSLTWPQTVEISNTKDHTRNLLLIFLMNNWNLIEKQRFWTQICIHRELNQRQYRLQLPVKNV